jgi:probable HAF family extracellular repeat protein
VGNFTMAHGPPHVFLYAVGKMTDLGTLGGFFPTGINASGQIVGGTTSGSTAYLYAGGQLQDLGTPYGGSFAPTGINASGQVVGTSPTANNSGVRAFLYGGGKVQDLGTLGGGLRLPLRDQ